MRRLRKESGRSLLVALVLVCVIPLLAGPVDAELLKIGYVDVENVINESASGKQVVAKLRKDLERRVEELKKVEAKLKIIRAEMSSKGSVMSRERREQLQVEYRRDSVNLKRIAGDNSKEFNIRRKQALVNLTRMILDTVQAIGKEKNYTIIFRNEANFVLYTADQVDLTREVITRLDAQASKRLKGPSLR